MQQLHLNIRRISILTGIGADQISFHVPNDQALDKILGNTKARECFSELCFDLRITQGKGKDLLTALGLTANEIITRGHSYNFGSDSKGD